MRVYAKRMDDFSCALSEENVQKNRYGNILPCAHRHAPSLKELSFLTAICQIDNQTRVKLSSGEDDDSDYINASFIKVIRLCLHVLSL